MEAERRAHPPPIGPGAARLDRGVRCAGARRRRELLTGREEAEALDAADPLAGFRGRFALDAGDRIYLDGNSLGRLPHAARDRLAARVDDWAARLVSGWPEWIELPERVGGLLGRACLGAGPGTVLVADSTTVNLYKLAAAALAARPGRPVLVTDAGEFPTDRYVLQGLGDVRLLDADPVHGPTAADIAAACAPGDVALVALSLVSYRSGALADLRGVTAAAQAGGALMLWDLSHAAGAVTVELDAAGVDLAVGCTYKYLNAGPGAPAFLYVRHGLQRGLRSPIQGWFGQRDQFRMGPAYEPVDGIGRFAAGTPPILGIAAVEAGAELVAEAGIGAIRSKAAALTGLAVSLADERLAPLGFELGTPREADRRGAHVSLRHPQAWQVCQALIARADVVPDFRGPDAVRLGLPPLYTRFVDVWDAVDRLATLVGAGEHEAFPTTLARVT